MVVLEPRCMDDCCSYSRLWVLVIGRGCGHTYACVYWSHFRPMALGAYVIAFHYDSTAVSLYLTLLITW